MAKKKDIKQLTPLELEIMKVLWELGPSTVQVVQGHLKQDLAYTTIQTMLNLLHKKSKVERKLINRAYYYEPIVSYRQVVGQTVSDLIDKLFDGSVENLVISLFETQNLTKEKLEKLNKLIDKSKEGKNEISE
jgi:predicted transcriptional regulator